METTSEQNNLFEDVNNLFEDIKNIGNPAFSHDIETTNSFNLYCCPRYGVYGIWILLDNTSCLINNPFSLVLSLFRNQNIDLTKFPDVTKQQINAYSQIQNHCIEWVYRRPNKKSVNRLYFSFQTYIDKIRAAFDLLQEILHQNSTKNNVVYNPKEVTSESIAHCLRQMAIHAVLPCNHLITSADIEVEQFAFYPNLDLKDNESHEEYHIGIGNRGFNTFLTHWDNDYNRIRHQLENYVYEKEAMLTLSFDTSDTILKIKRENILNKVSSVGHGYTFSYQEYILAEITPCEFGPSIIIKGYCNEKQTLTMLYEGLLSMALTHDYDDKHDAECEELPLLKAYNQLKSPLIENYIHSLEDNDNKLKSNNPINEDTDIDRRQQIIRTILQINPDYDTCFYYLSEDHAPLSIENDQIDGLMDANGVPIVIPGYSAWLEELQPIIIASETGHDYTFDWQDYHRRGIALAKQLRALLPDDTDLWYSAPFEDTSQQIPRPILIRKTYTPFTSSLEL